MKAPSTIADIPVPGFFLLKIPTMLRLHMHSHVDGFNSKHHAA
jgi:hypothetical protein